MCGIVGVSSGAPVALALYDSLMHLQHRGQVGAGIVTDNGQFRVKRDEGLVREIFTRDALKALTGNFGIGHVRYPTDVPHAQEALQPFCQADAVALAHNGHIINQSKLADSFRTSSGALQSFASDSALLLALFCRELQLSDAATESLCFEAICISVKHIFAQVQGAYSVVSLLLGRGLVAFRDPQGIRPLVYGARRHPDGRSDRIFASEPTMFHGLGYTSQGDVAPGEVIFVGASGKIYRRLLAHAAPKPCVFEIAYLARPDATLHGVNVYEARLRLGKKLGEAWQRTYPDDLPDVVIPIPFTANTVALGLAKALEVPYEEGLYKNPFIGRTFMMATKTQRQRALRYKFTPHVKAIKDKIVLLVDDSIVRGTTSSEIIPMIKACGAKKIYFASACAPIVSPCFYGIDIPDRRDLIASGTSAVEIRKRLGVDKLLYQTSADLAEAVIQAGMHSEKKLCMHCMSYEDS